MSRFIDYMYGVPVKISEKYKRPPSIQLPYSLSDCSNRALNFVENAKYCSKYESNVLVKVRELKNAKETKNNEWRHRLQLLEEAKQKKLDALAMVEAEMKLKQLSVSEVSYPSTEDINNMEANDSPLENCDRPANDSTVTCNIELPSESVLPSCSSHNNTQMNILQPIPVHNNSVSNNLLDDPDPIQQLKMQVKSTQIPQYNTFKHNIDNLTYKDFENDTSSPFDNVELKAFNDMEMLAQVLDNNNDQMASNSENIVPPYTNVPNCPPGMFYIPNSYVEQSTQCSRIVYPYPVTNGYYIDNYENNMYLPEYQYYPNYYVPYYNEEITSNTNYYYPTPEPYQNQCLEPEVASQPMLNTQSNNSTFKSRSRSVPDIVKELNQELELAHQRAAVTTCNGSPVKEEPTKPSTSIAKEVRKKCKSKEQLRNPYDNLPTKLQEMCQRIHGMGFPIDRVARICTLLGDNDKKIVEGLLILSELMDLGFSEGKASAALAKHQFNKDKAIDELVK